MLESKDRSGIEKAVCREQQQQGAHEDVWLKGDLGRCQIRRVLEVLFKKLLFLFPTSNRRTDIKVYEGGGVK